MSTAAVNAEQPQPRSWSSGMAPAYIGTFLWVAFLDKLGVRALPVGGLIPALMGVVAAAILAYLLLYRTPASWGFSARCPLDVVASSTFGNRGTLALPNLVLALGQVLLFAVAIGYATSWILNGLRVLGLLEARVVRPIQWGDSAVPSPLFLTTALVWGVVTALVGMSIVRWIAAIMQYFPVFPAAGLALAVAGTLSGLRGFEPTLIDPLTGASVAMSEGWRLGFLTTFQWTFGFAALLGITGADWAAASLSQTDVRRGGWVSLTLAPIVVASLAFLTVIGAEGKIRDRAASTAVAAPTVTDLADRAIERAAVGESPAEPSFRNPSSRFAAETHYTLRAAIEGGLDRRLGGVVLIVFGLASLAPACYAAFEFGRRLHRVAPALSKPGWTLVGVASAWFLIVGNWHERTGSIFTILGALYAPVAGAMVADATRQRSGDWNGPRPGVNFAGFLAWSVGLIVGLVPLVASALDSTTLSRFMPAALYAFIAAFVTYRVAAALGLEPRSAATTDSELTA